MPQALTLIGYVASGLVCYLIYVALLSISLIHFEYTSITSAIISYGVAMLINFLLNFKLVFKVEKHITRRAIFYCLVGLFGYSLNVAGFHLLHDNLGLHYLIANLVVFFVVGTFLYLVNKNLTFKKF